MPSHGRPPAPVVLGSSSNSGAATPEPATPGLSYPSGLTSRASRISAGALPPQKYFHSRRVKKEEIEKPWLEKHDPREKWVTIIPCIGLFFGLVACGALVWEGLGQVVNHTYCEVLNEDFSRGFDPGVWLREVEVGGFG